MKIGVLQTGHLPEDVQKLSGDYDHIFAQLLAAHGLSSQAWHVVDGIFPDGPEAADGWLITGSKFGAYENLPWIPPLEDLIRTIHAAQRPMIGICFGHQIIAQALGGRVEKFKGGWSVGRQSYDFKGREVAVNAWHQDQVTTPPPGAEIIARSEFCANAGFVIGDQVMTIQPHPEFGTDILAALLAHRAPGVVPDGHIQQAKADLDTPTERLDVFAEMAAFLKQGANHG